MTTPKIQYCVGVRNTGPRGLPYSKIGAVSTDLAAVRKKVDHLNSIRKPNQPEWVVLVRPQWTEVVDD